MNYCILTSLDIVHQVCISENSLILLCWRILRKLFNFTRRTWNKTLPKQLCQLPSGGKIITPQSLKQYYTVLQPWQILKLLLYIECQVHGNVDSRKQRLNVRQYLVFVLQDPHTRVSKDWVIFSLILYVHIN